MNDMSSVPLRGQTNTAGRERSAPPPDPAQMLLKNQPAKDQRKTKGRIALMVGGAVLALQLLAPQPLRPAYLVGSAAAEFYAQIMAASQINQERVAHQSGLAARLADLQARYSEARARCFWGIVLGPEAESLCVTAVDLNFQPAIEQIRRQLGQ